MPKLLELTRLGNPILRQTMPSMSKSQILDRQTQELIENIRHTNQVKQYGVGLAAPQVGKSIALSVIGIKPTPTRPNLERFDQVIINPEYVGIGRRVAMWEGCQSSGAGDDTLYAKVPRFRKITATWHDEHAKPHQEELSGFVAHVFQHETDHLHGILYVDLVRDPKTYMLASEYRERVAGADRG